MTGGRAAAGDAGRVRPGPLRGLLGAAAALLLVLFAAAGLKSWRDLEAARAREALLNERIERTGARVEELARRIELLRGDPVTLERVAREELGMVRPGDLVVVLPPEDAPAVGAEAAEPAAPRAP